MEDLQISSSLRPLSVYAKLISNLALLLGSVQTQGTGTWLPYCELINAKQAILAEKIFRKALVLALSVTLYLSPLALCG